MGINTTIGNFIKGIGSSIAHMGALKDAVSCAVANGVEGGITRAMPTIMKGTVLGAIFLTGTFLLGLGIAKWAQSLFATPGLGFALTGLFLLAAAHYYMATNSEGK